MALWTAFPFDASPYRLSPAELEARWPRLHWSDAEPLPGDALSLRAWALFHAGEFQQAVATGLQAAAQGHSSGMNAANKAQIVYAIYLERSETLRFALLLEASRRAEAQIEKEPTNANAHYLMACALGRYAQSISVAKALSLGIGRKVLQGLERAVALQPRHAEAHMALGSFHAEVIDTVGTMLGRTQGANREAGLMALKTALRLHPESALIRMACASGLLMLEGEPKAQEAELFYAQASVCIPQDAAEHLDVERARAELADDLAR
jgi:tetratricopeptide (TPR) repeat protein